MVRKWLTLDGEVLEESDWSVKPIDRCFYCNDPLIAVDSYCSASLDHAHDWISLVSPAHRR
jgi:hypothetical protein